MMNFWTRLIASITTKPKDMSSAPIRSTIPATVKSQPNHSGGVEAARQESVQQSLQTKTSVEVAPKEAIAAAPEAPRTASTMPAATSAEMVAAIEQFRQMLKDNPHPWDSEPGNPDDEGGDADPNVAGLELSMVTEARRLRRAAIDEALCQSLINPLQAKMLNKLADDLEQGGASPDEIEERLRFKIDLSLTRAPTPTLKVSAPVDDLLADFLESKRIYDAKHARRDQEEEKLVERGPTLGM